MNPIRLDDFPVAYRLARLLEDNCVGLVFI
jgi:hypothetical protein